MTHSDRDTIMLEPLQIPTMMQGHPRVKFVDSDVVFGRDLVLWVITFDLDVGFG